MVRVLIVDDHPPFLRVAHDLVAATPGFAPAGEAGSGEDGLAAAERSEPDLVLADVHMPGMNGVEMARRMMRASKPPVVVLITAEDPADLPAAARTCGAADIIAKQDLGPARLSRLWREHGAGRAGPR